MIGGFGWEVERKAGEALAGGSWLDGQGGWVPLVMTVA